MDLHTVRDAGWNRCSLWFNIVLLKYAKLFVKKTLSVWVHMLLQNLYKPFSIDGASPDVYVASSIGTNGPSYRQRCRLLNCALITRRMVPLLFSHFDMSVHNFPLCLRPFSMGFGPFFWIMFTYGVVLARSQGLEWWHAPKFAVAGATGALVLFLPVVHLPFYVT